MNQISDYPDDDFEDPSSVDNHENLAPQIDEGEDENLANDEDQIVCEVCLDGEVYDDNEIIFCDKCDVAVHQLCYGVATIPEGSWFCYVCAQGLNPKEVSCELCSNRGGAYKMTEKAGKWAHPLCAAWIPEIYEVPSPSNGSPMLKLQNLDKKRFKLRCSLCNSKGACAQCCFGRCTTAAHPWCILKTPKGFTKRIIKNDEGALVWEIFCKAHAKAVTEPYRPRVKAKQQIPIAVDDEDDDFIEPAPAARPSTATSATPASGGKPRGRPPKNRPSVADDEYVPPPKVIAAAAAATSTAPKPKLSMSHAKQAIAAKSTSKGKHMMTAASAASAAMVVKKVARKLNLDDDDVLRDDSSVDTAARSNITSGSNNNAKNMKKSGKKEGGAFPILNLLEWPGQSEGEAMDLEHYWNVMASYSPEDHTSEWLEYMLAPFLHFQEAEGNGATVLAVPDEAAIAERKSLSEVLDEKLASFGSDRDKAILFDPQKRHAILQNMIQRMADLEGKYGPSTAAAVGAGKTNLERADTAGMDVDEDERNGSAASTSLPSPTKKAAAGSEEAKEGSAASQSGDPSAATKTVEEVVREQRSASQQAVLASYLLSENEYYTKSHLPVTTDSAGGVKSSHGAADELHVVFDGNSRQGCTFRIQPHDYFTEKGAHSVTVSSNHKYNKEYNDWVAANLIPAPGDAAAASASSENLQKSMSVLTMDESIAEPPVTTSFDLSMLSSAPIDGNAEVTLQDRILLSRAEDNVIMRHLKEDQHLYAKFMDILQQKFNKLLDTTNIRSLSGLNLNSKREWDEINKKYQRQQVWKRVCNCLHRGVRDQAADFNKAEAEAVPASWTLKVDGRPLAVKDDEDEEEVHEDTVCMCCFDGSSSEGNRILFCDGCNATMHQMCYGISEIPEGDFYCDRCSHIQRYIGDADVGEFTGDVVKNAVMCCLCPQYHGAIKPTTDGRWVHLCCAMWAPESRILDMTEMGPVDVSQVAVQHLAEDEENRRSRKNRRAGEEDASVELVPVTAPGQSAIAEPCMYCHVYGGYVVRCCHSDEATPLCKSVFHPICAWFEGVYISSTLTDLTYTGIDANGAYPSGITFQFTCSKHSKERHESKLEEEQTYLRNKYRIKEEDLEQIPENNKKKRRKPKNKKQGAGGGGGGRQTGAAVVKDLNPDHYDDKSCAICFQPVTRDAFSCNYDPSKLTCSDASVEEARLAAIAAEQRLAALQQSIKSETDQSSQPSAATAKSQHSGMDIVPKSPVAETAAAARVLSQQFASPESFKALLDVNTAAAKAPSGVLKCTACSVVVHRQCLECACKPFFDANATEWTCDRCRHMQYLVDNQMMAPGTEDAHEVRCTLCPRRGGYFKRTTEGENKWAHMYCAQWIPGHVKVLPIDNGTLEITSVPKENRKLKCNICNRKCGVCVRCSYLGCTNHFHPICGTRSGKACIRNRMGVKQILCFDHTPEGMEKLRSGYWVDGHEIARFRYSLDRGRLITDILLRREKIKKILCKNEIDVFTNNFYKIFDNAKGRKHVRATEEEEGDDISDISAIEDSDSDSDLENSQEDGWLLKNKSTGSTAAAAATGAKPKGAPGRKPRGSAAAAAALAEAEINEEDFFVDDDFVPFPQLPGYEAPAAGEEELRKRQVDVVLSKDITVRVSKTWLAPSSAAATAPLEHPELRMPTRILITYSGVEVNEKDTMIDGESKKSFLKATKDVIQKNLDVSRQATMLFVSQRDEDTFGRHLGPELVKHMTASFEDFKKDMMKYDARVEIIDTRRKRAPKKETVKETAAAEDMVSPAPAAANEGGSSKRGRRSAAQAAEVVVEEASGKKMRLKKGYALVPAPGDTSDDDQSFIKLEKFPKGESISAASTPAAAQKKGRKSYLVKLDEDEQAELEAVAEEEEPPQEQQQQPKKRGRKKRAQSEIESVPTGDVASGSTHKSKRFRSKDALLMDILAAEEQASSPKKGKRKHSMSSAAEEQEEFVQTIKNSPAKRISRHHLSKSVFQSRRELKEELQEDEAFAFYVRKHATDVKGKALGFEQVIQRSEVLNRVETAEDWALCSSVAEQNQLERRLFDILQDLDHYEVPDSDFEQSDDEGSSPRKSRKSSAKKAESQVKRELAADFTEVPFDIIPDYTDFVRCIVTLDSMRERLKLHEYRSMAEFSKDFYTLINNARSVSVPNTRAWHDAQRLSEVFEAIKAKSATESTASKPRSVDCTMKVIPAGKKGRAAASEDAAPATCCCCDKSYHVEAWPEEFDLTLPYHEGTQRRRDAANGEAHSDDEDEEEEEELADDNYPSNLWAKKQLAAADSDGFQFPDDYVKGKDSKLHKAKEQQFRKQWGEAVEQQNNEDVDTWRWVCPSCLTSSTAELIGKEVMVWWHDDRKAYRGLINAYDDVSQTYRVLYEDSEWEFINLAVEPFLIHPSIGK